MIASVTVGRKDARPRAIGIWAISIMIMPSFHIPERPIRKHDIPKLVMLRFKPNFGFFLASHLPIGH